MSGYTKEEIQVFYDNAKAAYLDATNRASMNLSGRGKTNQSLPVLKAEMDQWRAQLDAANGESNGIEIVRVVSRFDV